MCGDLGNAAVSVCPVWCGGSLMIYCQDTADPGLRFFKFATSGSARLAFSSTPAADDLVSRLCLASWGKAIFPMRCEPRSSRLKGGA